MAKVDKTQVITAMKRNMTQAEKGKSTEINNSIAMCLDDLSNRLQSEGLMTTTEVPIAADTRSKELSGEVNDLNFIFALKYGTGNEQKIMEYVEAELFLKLWDNPSAVAGDPSRYTILTSISGNPVVKFDVPAKTADTLVLYYFADLTVDNMTRARSSSAIVAGSLAYFYGFSEQKGAIHYERYKVLVQMMRAGDKFRAKKPGQFVQSKEDRDIRTIQQNIRSRRS